MSENESSEVGHEFSLRSLGLAPVPLLGQEPPAEPVPRLKDSVSGKTDVQNIFYVNLIPEIPQAIDQLKKLQLANEQISQYFSVKAGELADDKIKNKQLSLDPSIKAQIERSNYRAAVIEYAIKHTHWLHVDETSTYTHVFDVDTKKFHAALLEVILKGLPISAAVYPQFEKVLTAIVDSVNVVKSEKVTLKHRVLLFTYRWDEKLKRVFTCEFSHCCRNYKTSLEWGAHMMNLAHRMIYYEINHSIVEVVDKKNTQKQVHLDLAYKQDDLTLTESEWEKYQTKVQKIIEENDTIFKVIDIPVH